MHLRPSTLNRPSSTSNWSWSSGFEVSFPLMTPAPTLEVAIFELRKVVHRRPAPSKPCPCASMSAGGGSAAGAPAVDGGPSGAAMSAGSPVGLVTRPDPGAAAAAAAGVAVGAGVGIGVGTVEPGARVQLGHSEDAGNTDVCVGVCMCCMVCAIPCT
jgi:hypothetical protein